MRAIILAAGRGRRLESMGWTDPKCLLPVGDSTILDNMLDAIAAHGIDDVVLVVGYRQELIRAVVERRGLRPTYVENMEYERTNTIHSLWRARDLMDDDFIYFNADVWFHPDVLGRLIAEDGTRLALDRKRCAEEEVKVILDEDGRVRRIGKVLDPALCAGEFIGIGKFVRSANDAFVAALRDRVEVRNDVTMFFEAAVDDILADVPMYTSDVSDLPTIEIDFPEDYRAAGVLAARSAEGEGLPQR